MEEQKEKKGKGNWGPWTEERKKAWKEKRWVNRQEDTKSE